MFEIRSSIVCGLLAALALGCGPRDAVPSSPTHPANPAAPAGATDGGGHAASSEDLLKIYSTEQAAYQRALPVFEAHCARCHKPGGDQAKPESLAHFDMGHYPFGGHHEMEVGKVVLEVLGASGKKATMPADQPGAVQGDELEAVKAWAAAFTRSHEAGLHHHAGHDHEHGDAHDDDEHAHDDADDGDEHAHDGDEHEHHHEK